MARLGCTLVLACLCAPGMAEAQTQTEAQADASASSQPSPADRSERDQQARQHFVTGSALFQSGEYERAIAEFEASYRLSRRPQLLFNLALCYERLGQLERAIESLGAYLDSGVEIPNRVPLAMRLSKMKERLAARAASESAEPQQPQPDPGAAADPAAPADATTRAESGGRTLTTPAIVSLVAGGAGLLTFASFGPLSLIKKAELEDACAPDCSDDDVRPLHVYRTVADIGLGVAILGVALGGTLWWLSDESPDAPERAALVPWVGSGAGGVDASWRF